MSRTRAPDGSRRGIVISADLGYLAGKLVATASATYARLGIGSLEARVLAAIGDRTACNGAQVSKAIGVDPAAVSRTLKALISSGAVHKSHHITSRISLTPKGELLCQAVRAIAEERDRRLVGGLSDDDQALMLRYLERLWNNTPALADLAAMTPPYAETEDDKVLV